jgi:hypothetical protein
VPSDIATEEEIKAISEGRAQIEKGEYVDFSPEEWEKL